MISLAVGFVAATAWADPPANNTAAVTTSTASPATPAPNTGNAPNRAKLNLNIPIQSATAPPPRPRMLDLKPPDIQGVMPASELTTAIPDPDAIDVLEPETVAVHGDVPTPYVPTGFASLYWAATNPSSAWRILAPVQ